MAAFWILKSEPSSYAFSDLERDGRTTWNGVRNPQALIHIRAMRTGDRALFYHTGAAKALVGLTRVVSEPYPDPDADDPKLAVVDLEPDHALRRSVTLAAIKADSAFAELGLVRQGRLSVVPVSAAHWARLMRLAGEKA